MISQDFLPIPGGIGIFLHNLCIQLCRLGHEVHVLTPCQKNWERADYGQPYRVYRYTYIKRLSSLLPLWGMLSLYCANKYDLSFLGHFMTTHALGALILRKVLRIPYVILSHGNDLHYSITTKTDRCVANLLLNNASLMLGNSRFTARLIRQKGYRGPVELLYPGVNPEQFNPHIDTTEIRRKYELDKGPLLLTTARLASKKNIEGVLRALHQVIKYVPNMIYVVAGDGEERERLEFLCDELCLRPYVRFLGYIDNSELPALYCASDLFVMPSYEFARDVETFGISFIEANACGLSVIGGRGGGTADAVIDGVTGLLVDPHNVDEIASAIIRLLTDEEYAQRLGENGRRRVDRELSWQKVGERLEKKLWRAVMHGKTSLA